MRCHVEWQPAAWPMRPAGASGVRQAQRSTTATRHRRPPVVATNIFVAHHAHVLLRGGRYCRALR